MTLLEREDFAVVVANDRTKTLCLKLLSANSFSFEESKISVLDFMPVPFDSVVNFLNPGHSWLLIKLITFLSVIKFVLSFLVHFEFNLLFECSDRHWLRVLAVNQFHSVSKSVNLFF